MYVTPTWARSCRLIAVTGGPASHKAEILDVLRKQFCEHVGFLPDAAEMMKASSFQSIRSGNGLRSALRAFFHLQTELERTACEEGHYRIVVCARSTLDSLAAWSGDEESFWAEVHSSHEAELERYEAVIHLRSPRQFAGFDALGPHFDALNVVDQRIERVWAQHSQRHVVEWSEDLISRASKVAACVGARLPESCHDEAHRTRLARRPIENARICA